MTTQKRNMLPHKYTKSRLQREKKMQRKLLVVTELFNIAASGFDAKKSVPYMITTWHNLVIFFVFCFLISWLNKQQE